MKRLLATLALAISASAGAAPLPAPDYLPLDTTARIRTPDTFSRHSVREASLEDAVAVLKQPESGLRPFAAMGPACHKNDTRKSCKAKTLACKKAKSFAKKYSLHVVCSALYDQATILLTTVPAPAQETAGASAVDAGSEDSERGNSQAVPQ